MNTEPENSTRASASQKERKNAMYNPEKANPASGKVDRDAWDERAERENDLRREGIETAQREESGYWDNYDDAEEGI